MTQRSDIPSSSTYYVPIWDIFITQDLEQRRYGRCDGSLLFGFLAWWQPLGVNACSKVWLVLISISLLMLLSIQLCIFTNILSWVRVEAFGVLWLDEHEISSRQGSKLLELWVSIFSMHLVARFDEPQLSFGGCLWLITSQMYCLGQSQAHYDFKLYLTIFYSTNRFICEYLPCGGSRLLVASNPNQTSVDKRSYHQRVDGKKNSEYISKWHYIRI